MDGLDLKILEGKKNRVITSEEALRDVIPIDWSEDVLNGKAKAVLKPARPESGRPTE